MHKGFLVPSEICALACEVGANKRGMPLPRLLVLAVLAGAFIAFASQGSTMAAFGLLSNPETVGLGRVLAGLVFPTGLMLVVLTGAELFTGNTLMSLALFQGRIRLGAVLWNWGWVYLGNLAGCLLLAWMIAGSGQWGTSGNLLGGMTVKIAHAKVNLTFLQAFYLGILCNWLVCLAIWLSWAARDLPGKMLGIFFPIWLFITSGFEHCIANMYFIPAGILASGNPLYAGASGLSAASLQTLNWQSFFLNNLLPVTLGNIIGGFCLVGMVYWFAFLKGGEK